MNDQLFEKFRELIHSESGIALTEEKRALLGNRINRRLRALNISSEKDYLDHVLMDKTGDELIKLLDAVSTNVTYFYREADHFDILSKELVELRSKNKREIKLWCAAASSGEEPYTLSITAAEALKSMPPAGFKLLATDISTKVLKHATTGIYQEKQLSKTPPEILKKYFSRTSAATDSDYQVNPKLKDCIKFRRLNLAQFPFPLKGPLDIIFCRNVMIYFDLELRTKIMQEFERLLAPGGLLFLSRSENLLGIKHGLNSAGSSVYRKP